MDPRAACGAAAAACLRRIATALARGAAAGAGEGRAVVVVNVMVNGPFRVFRPMNVISMQHCDN